MLKGLFFRIFSYKITIWLQVERQSKFNPSYSVKLKDHSDFNTIDEQYWNQLDTARHKLRRDIRGYYRSAHFPSIETFLKSQSSKKSNN